MKNDARNAKKSEPSNWSHGSSYVSAYNHFEAVDPLFTKTDYVSTTPR